jgi:hypothetical protein
MSLFLLALGCAERLTVVNGVVFESRDPLSPGLGGASVEFVDEYGERLDRVTADADGAFQVTVPSAESVFVVISADGFATTTFPGSIGYAEQAQVEDHALYGVTLAEREAWLAQYAGCAGADDPVGAVVVGEIREYGITDPYTGESPTTSMGLAELYDGGEAPTWTGCYLDADGVAWDPEAELTGPAGQFAVFGVGPGFHDLVIQTLIGPDLWTVDVYPMWVPEGDDVVSPWFPAWASFPLF